MKTTYSQNGLFGLIQTKPNARELKQRNDLREAITKAFRRFPRERQRLQRIRRLKLSMQLGKLSIVQYLTDELKESE